ncbi:MAG: transcriptional repressor LexA [Candidatus Komeilibacteria bacterium]|nr:transcriptional repressor LexA [Candidatus Komeilibacteria bacterium]
MFGILKAVRNKQKYASTQKKKKKYSRQGYAPSYREIASHFKLSSIATVHQHLKALAEKGVINLSPNKARTTELIKEKMNSFGQSMELPLVGVIAAGEPIEALENPEMMTIPVGIVEDPQSYVLKVKGTSMKEDGILDGDFVIVERNFYPKNGEVVVALLDNTYATLKKYYREKNWIRLQPANSNYEPILVKNPTIQGIVRGLIRKFAH